MGPVVAPGGGIVGHLPWHLTQILLPIFAIGNGGRCLCRDRPFERHLVRWVGSFVQQGV